MKVSRVKRAIGRVVIIAIVVVIIVIIAAAGVIALRPGVTSTSSTVTTSSASFSASSSLASTTSSSALAQSSTSSSKSSTTLVTTSSSSRSNGNASMVAEINVPTGTLDPFEDVGTQQGWVEGNIYDTLFYFNGSSSNVAPWLATSYSSNANASVWTVSLRHNVVFSDGTAFNATAVKDSIDWEILTHVGGGAQFLETVIPGALTVVKSNGNPANITAFENNDGITIVDQYTVQFRLLAPFVSFVAYLQTAFDTPIVSPSAVLAHGGVSFGTGASYLSTASAGSGPYQIKSFNTATGSIVLTKNPHYWGLSIGQPQPFGQVTVNVVANTLTEELDVRTGAADLISLPTTNIYDFANKTTWLSKGSLVSTVSGTSLYGPFATTDFALIMLNAKIYASGGTLAAVQPFQNQNMIAAFNYAWNETAFIQSAENGIGASLVGYILHGQLGYQNLSNPYPTNLTLAKQDITKACQTLGCSPSNPLQITLLSQNDPFSETASTMISSSINDLQAGVTVNLDIGVTAAVIGTFLNKQEGIWVGYFGNENADPLSVPFVTLVSPTSGIAASHLGFNNTQANQLLSQAEQTVNQTQRILLYQQLNKIVAQEGQYIQLGQLANVFVTSNRISIISENTFTASYLPQIQQLAPA